MRIFTYPSQNAKTRLQKIVGRHTSFRAKDLTAVNKILANVQKNGDQALVEYTNEFDSPKITGKTLRVTQSELDRAFEEMDPEFARTLDFAANNIQEFHLRQKPNSWVTTDRPGTFLGQMVQSVDAAGVYVPGGKGGNTPLVSSVLMGCIPAKIAGVERICVATPPRPDGTVHPYLLAAAKKCGVTEVYKMGSAWAIGALAYGTESVPKVDVIVGPGNIFVTIAKKLVAGAVGIDMVAGPSEVLVIADHTADPEHIAADLLSQAEHDTLSTGILVTTKKSLAQKAKKALEVRMAQLSRTEIATESIRKNGAAFVVPDLETAAELANAMAPEHLELLVDDPFALLPHIRHAGAVFMGHYTPEPVGDYVAGPNHVLPTEGAARFSSALGVEHFIKRTSILHYSKETFEQEAPHVIRIAETEGLTAHAESVRARLKK